MNSFDYLYRAAQFSESNRDIRVRLKSRQHHLVIRFCRADGGALEEHIPARRVASISEAIKRGLARAQDPTAARPGRKSMWDALSPIHPEKAVMQGSLSVEDRTALEGLVKFLDTIGRETGVKIEPALPHQDEVVATARMPIPADRPPPDIDQEFLDENAADIHRIW